MKDFKKQIKQLDRFRSQYNPLRSLTIQRVVGLLEQGELGNYAELQWLYRMIEKRDPVLRALIRRRAAALLKLDWNIKQVPEEQLPKGATAAQAEAQADALRAMYDGIANLKEAIRALCLAEFRGYTMLEKGWNGSTATKPEQIDSLNFIEQWYWTRDGYKGEWKFDPRMSGSHQIAEEVDLNTLVVREVSDPVNEIALIAFLRKNMSQKDWDGFVEVFGIPDIFFIMPQGLDQAQQTAWLETAERMAGDGRGALPAGGDVKSVGGDVRGTNPFKEHLAYQDQMVVLAGTGGKLTMLSDPTGIGQGATDAHENAFNELAQAEAAEISEVMQCCLDLPLLKKKFPDQPVLAYFEIAAADSEDITALIGNAEKLHNAGIEMDVDDLAERTGYKLARAPQPAFSPVTAAVQNRDTGIGRQASGIRGLWMRLFNRNQTPDTLDPLLKNARSVMMQAIAEDMKPVAERIAQILDETPDEELFQTLEKFRSDELPKLAAEVLAGTAGAEALEQSMAAALFNGLEGE